MTVGLLTLVSGTATSAQDFITIMDNTMVHNFGWELVSKVVNTNTIREYWWRSEGEVPGDRMTLYCGLLASGTNVYTRAATFVSGATVRDLMFSNTIAIVPWLANKKFWAAGNKDFVHFFSDVSNVHHAGGFGYLDTFYSYKADPYPVCIYGQALPASSFSDVNRLLAYTPSSLAIASASGVAGGGFLATTASGAFSSYTSDNYSTILQLNAPSLRDGRYTALRQLFYIPESTSLFNREVRGNLAYSWQIWNGSSIIGEPITASGFLFDSDSFTSSATFVITNETSANDNTYLIGPLNEFDSTTKGSLYTISGTKFFVEGINGVERNGATFHGGKVATWRDQSWHPKTERITRNDAIQSTASNQPVSIDNGLNSLPIVNFNSSSNQYLTGTIPVAKEGASTFVVASYTSGSTRTPLINIRGNLSAQDTLFSVEFNETSNNSATIVNIAAGGTDRAERTGLSANTYYLITNVVSGTTTTLYVNGSSASSSTLNDTKGTPVVSGTLNYSLGVNLVAGGTIGSSYANANIAEIIHLHKPVSNEERKTIHCMLSNKYGIIVADVC